jgi:ATP-binding cassette subfamily C (CFTR/MRP) protein 4
LIEKCILEYLKNKTRILITHQLQNIDNVDGIILIDKRKMYFYKNSHELLEKHPDYNLIVANHDENCNEDMKKTETKQHLSTVENKVKSIKIILFSCVNLKNLYNIEITYCDFYLLLKHDLST